MGCASSVPLQLPTAEQQKNHSTKPKDHSTPQPDIGLAVGITPVTQLAVATPVQKKLQSVAYIIDCGSSHTQMFRYTLAGRDELGQSCCRFHDPDGKGLKISELLPAGAEAWSAFLRNERWAGVDADVGAPIIFGCTAGVRRGMEAGAISDAHVSGFASALLARWPERRAELRVLSGLEEAENELVAARLLAGHFDCGLFSGGGASCQIATGDGEARRVLSVDVGTVEAREVLEREGEAAGMAWWRARLARVRDEVRELPAGGFSGLYAGTAMQCTAAKWLGRLPASTILTRGEVLAALDALVEAFLAPEEGNERMGELRAEAKAMNCYGQWTDENEAERWAFFKHIWLPGASRMQAMVRDLFAAEATFIFVHEAEVAPGVKLKAEWTLGFFLTLAGHPAGGAKR